MSHERMAREPEGQERGHEGRAAPGERAPGPGRLGPPANVILGLQRSAGNQAVASLLRRDAIARPNGMVVQAEPAPGGASTDPLREFGELWSSQVLERLAATRELLVSDPTHAAIFLSRATRFVYDAMEAAPESSAIRTKLGIVRRGLYGILGILYDRLDQGKGSSDTLTHDLREWRSAAVLLEPQLRNPPRAGAATTPVPGSPASPASPAPPGGPASPGGSPAPGSAAGGSLAERWHDGVVLPLGRALVRVETDPAAAVSEAALALEVIHLWREAAPPRSIDRLRLLAIERSVYYTVEQLRERTGGTRVDLEGELDKLTEEAGVVGSQLPGASSAAPARATPSPEATSPTAGTPPTSAEAAPASAAAPGPR